MLSEQQYEDITPEEMKIELGRKLVCASVCSAQCKLPSLHPPPPSLSVLRASKDKIKGIRGPIADTKNDLVYHGCPDVPNVHAN